jgi:hypothetical protein
MQFINRQTNLRDYRQHILFYDAVMCVLTHHLYDIRSDAWGHSSEHLIFYGHEPRLSSELIYMANVVLDCGIRWVSRFFMIN